MLTLNCTNIKVYQFRLITFCCIAKPIIPYEMKITFSVYFNFDKLITEITRTWNIRLAWSQPETAMNGFKPATFGSVI